MKFLDYITKNEKGIKVWSVLFCLMGITMAIFMTVTFYNPADGFVKNILPAFSVPIGFLCVYFLGIRKNIGNILGIMANIFEIIINVAFGNFGFVASTIYNMITHVIGYIGWNQNMEDDNTTKVRDMSKKKDVALLLIVLIISTLFVIVSYKMGWIDASGSSFLFIGNIIVMYLGIVAQGTMVLRYRYAWWIWFIYNLIAIPVQFVSGNYVFGIMYCFYQLNTLISLYAQYTVKEKSLD